MESKRDAYPCCNTVYVQGNKCGILFPEADLRNAEDFLPQRWSQTKAAGQSGKPWRRMPWWLCLCPSLRLGCCKQQWLAAARNRLMGLCGVKIKFVQNFVTAWLRQFQEVNDRATIMVLLVLLYDDKLGTSFFNTTEVMKVFKTTSTRATLKHVEMGKSDGCF